MFLTDVIILKKTLIRDRDCLYHVFSRDYGRISVWSRVTPTFPLVDTGAIVSFSISTSSGANRDQGHSVRRTVHTDGLDARSILGILHVVAMIEKCLPEGVIHRDIFDAYRDSLPHFEHPTDSEKNVGIFLLGLAETLGICPAWVRDGDNLTLRRIHAGIRRIGLPDMYRVSGITPEIVAEVRAATVESFHEYFRI